MPKTIPSTLLSDIQATVTTLATCIQITRNDGQILRMTTHDSDLSVDSKVYRHDMPFILGNIQSTSQLTVDNVQLTLFADEVNIFLADFKSGQFQYAAISIFQVNYSDTTRGSVIMRTGWLGQMVFSENHVVQITITGLTKVLDLEVGRVFQPSCDADLGDDRCRVAIQQSQLWSELNPYRLGDWVYKYDTAAMTALTVVNHSFETDGAIGNTTPITGWTKTPGAEFQVRGDNGGLGTFSVLDGSFMLVGAAITTAPFESGIYQDIDVAGQIGSTTALDAGKISILLRGAFLSTLVTTNTWRLRAEVMDVNGVIIDSQDSRYVLLDAIDSWRTKAVVMPLLPGARKVRVWLYNYSGSTGLTGAADAADRIEMYYWDHTTGTPYHDVIHHMLRVGPADATRYMYYGSFEGIPGGVANANNPVIPSWTTGAGNWWQVVTTAWSGALTGSVDGSYFLAGGDDGGSTTHQYVISQIHPLLTQLGVGGWALDNAQILLGKYVATLLLWVGYGDTTSKATVTVEWMSDITTVIGSANVVVNDALGTVGWHAVTSAAMQVPGNAQYVRVTLKARSPVGSGSAKVGFDNVRFNMVDIGRPTTSDPTSGFGSASTVFDTTVGDATVDGGLLWQAVSALVGYDVVATVVDAHKEFTGTAIAGASGTFETGPIRFITGNNKGLRNIVRKWTPGTVDLKMYFRTPFAIQVGDRFYHTVSCQRRFIQDCLLRFTNTINYQGFPSVPGGLMTQNANLAPPLPAQGFSSLPTSGVAAGGTIITIAGNSNFQFVTAIHFGGVLALNLVHVDNNTIRCTSPPHAVGAVIVTSDGVGPTQRWGSLPVGIDTATSTFTYV